jgi:hypothetical protein
MFGEDGWCRSCGTPNREQTGELVLQRRGLTATGAWMPNWRFDVLCLDHALAVKVSERFKVRLRDVRSPKDTDDALARQLVFTLTDAAWFDPTAVRSSAIERHGATGDTCAACGTWRWPPLTWKLLPAPAVEGFTHGAAAVASPEWFGSGCQSFRQTLLLRPLAELIASSSPREFTIRTVL